MVARVDPRRHALLASMLEVLERVPTPERIVTSGAWGLPLSPRPTGDRPRPWSFQRGVLQPLGFSPPKGVHVRCHNYFPVDGGMDWHTDSDAPAWRAYVFRAEPGTATFRYQDSIFEEGAEGAYVFETAVGTWHSVESRRKRWSCGVQIEAALAREIIATAGLTDC